MKKFTIILIISLIAFEAFAQDKDFRNLEWGMSISEVEKIENIKDLKKFSANNIEIIFNKKGEGANIFVKSETFNDFNMDVYFYFIDNKFCGGGYNTSPYDNIDSIKDDYYRLNKFLESKYGNPSKGDKPDWDKVEFKRDWKNLDFDKVKYANNVEHNVQIWENDDTMITLKLLRNDLEIEIKYMTIKLTQEPRESFWCLASECQAV